MARTTTITKQDVINDVHRVSKQTVSGKVRVTDYTKKGAFSIGTITRMFGSAKNDVFNHILQMDPNDDILDQSTLMMLTRKFVKQMEENGLEFSIETFEKTANFDVSMLAKSYGSIEDGLVAADILMYVEYDPKDEDTKVVDDHGDDLETTGNEYNVDNDENIDNYDGEDNTVEDSYEEDLVDDDNIDNEYPVDDFDDDNNDIGNDVYDLDEDDAVDDINLDDFDLSDFDLDIADLGDDDAFFDAMTDSYEDDFYKEEDLKAVKMEMQQLFGGSRW